MHPPLFPSLMAGMCIAKTKSTRVGLHLCEGEARVLRRGVAGASMEAHRPLVQEAKGHRIGIGYTVRKWYFALPCAGPRVSPPHQEL